MYLETSGPGAATPAITAPPFVNFVTTTGAGTYTRTRVFIILSGSATSGAQYTNNGVTFTVTRTVTSATQIYLTGNGTPTTSGTLVNISGTGDATLTFTSYLDPLYLEIEAVGAGGGGGGSGTGSPGAGGTGGNTTFNTTTVVANGGTGGATSSNGGVAGTASLSGIFGTAVSGSDGCSGATAVTASGVVGGSGGVSALGGAGKSNSSTGAGSAGATGSGSGGGGASSATGGNASGGGGSGGYAKGVLPNPSLTYSYSIGAGGSAGTAGTSGFAGGAGGSGSIKFSEYYQYDNTRAFNAGVSIVDFGAFPGASDASLAITGQTNILAGSSITCQLTPVATADHSADEHIAESLGCYAGNIIAGTGFTIYLKNNNNLKEPDVIPQAAGSLIQTSATAVGFKVCPAGKNLSDYSGQATRIYGKWSVAWHWN